MDDVDRQVLEHATRADEDLDELREERAPVRGAERGGDYRKLVRALRTKSWQDLPLFKARRGS
jgi:hypothetical protein